MKNKITEIYYRLLDSIQTETHRFLFNDFNIDRQLTGLIGPRGTGKTTLLLQYIKEKIEDIHKVIYVSMDHIYFSNIKL